MSEYSSSRNKTTRRGYNCVNEAIGQQVVCLKDGQPGRTPTPGPARLWSSERSFDSLNGEVLKDPRLRG
jgi:hypothetical protein